MLALLACLGSIGMGGCADEGSTATAEDDAALPRPVADATTAADAAGDAADAATPCIDGEGTWCPVAITLNGVDLTSVWGSGPSNVWAVGFPGAVLRFDGKAWVARPSQDSYRLSAVWGSGARDVWIVNSDFQTLHYDGRESDGGPLLVGPPPPDPLGDQIFQKPLRSLWGSSATDVWAAGAQVFRSAGFVTDAGPGWQEVPEALPAGFEDALRSGWAESASTAYAVGTSGAIVRITKGDAGIVTAKLRSGTYEELRGVGGVPGGDIIACGSSGTILRASPASGADRVFAPQLSGSTEDLNGVWGAAPDDVWAVGNRGTLLHWDGKQWKQDPSVRTKNDLLSVWGSSAGDVWAVGSEVILHRTTRKNP